MKTSKLVNDYVKADKEAASVNAEIKAQTEDLQIKLKALKKRREDLKNAIMKELEASNSKRLESKTNFVIWDPTDVAAHVRNNILVNKEPKPKSE